MKEEHNIILVNIYLIEMYYVRVNSISQFIITVYIATLIDLN